MGQDDHTKFLCSPHPSHLIFLRVGMKITLYKQNKDERGVTHLEPSSLSKTNQLGIRCSSQ